MNRRIALRLALAMPVGALAGFSIQRTWAQEVGVIPEMIEQRSWQDRQVFVDLRRLAAALIELRIVYNGPNDHEAEPPFVDGAFPFWREALGASGEAGWQRALSSVDPMPALAANLSEEMNGLLEENGERFTSWLAGLGIERGSKLQVDFLRAQAMFAVMAAVLLGGGQTSTFSEFTWIFPFC